MKSVAIIILNWNGKEETLSCLSSVSKLKKTNCVIAPVVVDNASTDDSVAVIRNDYPEITLLENTDNLGFAEGMNTGIRYAMEKKYDYVMILNNDTVLDEHLVVELVEMCENHPKAGIISPKIYFYPKTEFHYDRYKEKDRGKVLWYAGGVIDWKNIIASHRGVDDVDTGQFDKEESIDFATGCCMLIKREVFDVVGLFDNDYFLYYEDNDFSLRVKRYGFQILFAPKAILWHKNAVSSGGSGSKLQDYYITRNRLLFASKYASIRARLAVFREGLKLLITGRDAQKNGAKDFFLGKFGKGHI